MKGLLILFLLFQFLGLIPVENAGSNQDVGKAKSNIKEQWSYLHAYLTLPDSLYKENQFDSAFFYYEKAAKLFFQEENYEGILKCQNMIASKYLFAYQLDTAISILNNAMEMAQNHIDTPQAEIANTFFLLGRCYDFIGDAEMSLEKHYQALNMKMQLFGEYHTEVARSYNGIGDVYLFTKQDHLNAEKNIYHSLKILEKLNLGPNKFLADSYYNLAAANRFKEDYEKALIYANQALRTYRLLPQNTQNFILNCYILLADIYHDKQDLDSAQNLNLRTLDYLSDLEPLNVLEQSQKANCYKNLGTVLTKKKQYMKARYYYNESLKIYQPEDHQLEISFAYLNLGINLTQLNEFDSASLFLNESLDIRIAKYGKKHSTVSHNLRFIGDLHRIKYEAFGSRDQLDSALTFYQKALVAASVNLYEEDENTYSNPKEEVLVAEDALLLALSEKGKALKMLYHAANDRKSLMVALECFNLTLRIIELNRQSFEQEGSKLLLSEIYHSIYENTLDCLFLLYTESKDLNYLQQAFAIMEKSKAQLILESFNKIVVASKVGIPDSLITLENSLKADLAYLRRQLSNTPSEGDANSLKVEEFQKKIFQITRKQELLNEFLASLYPSYYQIKYGSDLSFKDIQNQIIATQSQLLEFFWGENAIYGITVGPSISEFKKIDKKGIEVKVMEYRNQLLKGPQFKDRKKRFDVFCLSAFSIYQTLVSNFIESNPNVDTKLVIIPDGLLRYIPFESLITSMPNTAEVSYKNLQYLLYEYQVSYGYSANLWARKTKKDPNTAGNKLLAFGYSKSNVKAVAETGNLDGVNKTNIDEIPGSGLEIETISKYTKGKYYIGKEATEQNFKANAQNYDIIHLAIHGISDMNTHQNNRLLFNKDNDNAQDGILYTHELYNLKLSTDLVVLSACESGVGKNYKGEGLYSIARGFAYAGCPNTILSLWKISDKTTPLILGQFYRHVAQGKKIHEALHLAKSSYLMSSSGDSAHPSNWAPLVVIGSDISFGRPPIVNYIFLLATGLVALIFMGKRFLLRK